MRKRAYHLHRSRKEKEIDYSNYHFAMALYAIYKKESIKEARLPADDFRSPFFQKQSGAFGLKQKLRIYILAFKKAITGNVFVGKEKPQSLINRLQ